MLCTCCVSENLDFQCSFSARIKFSTSAANDYAYILSWLEARLIQMVFDKYTVLFPDMCVSTCADGYSR